MNNFELAAKVKEIATKYKTLYILGCIGAPMTPENKKRYSSNYAYNAKPARKKYIEAATPDTFGFDCVCLIKSVLWGWNGNKSAQYGGAVYASNGVPDIGADAMIKACKNVSADFKNIEIGEAVWKSGHIGVYIGNGLAVECTPSWANKVQITAVGNIGQKTGYNTRFWTKHGKLPYISYYKIGDVDFDGKVSAADARTVLRAAVKAVTLTPAQLMAADVDGDGRVGANDARKILQIAVGLTGKGTSK